MPAPPTPRQLEVLRAIARHMRRCGVPPTTRELGRAFGMRATSGAYDHLLALETKGLLRTGRKAQVRVMRITDTGLGLLGIKCPYCEEVGHG